MEKIVPVGQECEQPDSFQHIAQIFQKQQTNKPSIIQSTAAERISRLKRMETWIINNRQPIQEAVYTDFRKPKLEVESQEIFVTLTEIRFAIRKLKKWMRPTPVRRTLPLILTRSWIEHVPRGVVLIFSPWNFPFLLSIGPLISAIAAGNCVMLKPSEISIHTSRLVKKMIRELFPENEIAVICGGINVATELLKYSFDHIYFTGSTEVGKIVMTAAAKNLSSLTLELGGKSPAVVDDTANLGDAAKKIIWGKLINAGQKCVSPDYVLVQENIFSKFLELLKKNIANSYGEDEIQRAASLDLPRIIDDRHYQRLKNIISEAVASGFKIEIGGIPNNGDRFVPPTLLSGKHSDVQLTREEIFGPVLPVIPFSNLAEAIDIINQKSKPLAVYIFSHDHKNIHKISKSTSSGGVCINEVTIQFIHPNLPFGGVRESGFGNAHGYFGFKTFSHERAFLKGSRWNPLKLLYPPYNGYKEKLTDILIKYF
jgi:aldehyde dehydrogenase (NAD+)